ncbi:hypothetical protein AC578_6491 [Pseudocercospora eumusae]|uniref:Uncharacterized protein n=1 Tax=Pseudocercospora eumusae TaxID=321146 RepID=A0A139HD41_9PEZI|nr:hypothetical protein AC578_6491 [Pseudocercospora eumusae]
MPSHPLSMIGILVASKISRERCMQFTVDVQVLHFNRQIFRFSPQEWAIEVESLVSRLGLNYEASLALEQAVLEHVLPLPL